MYKAPFTSPFDSSHYVINAQCMRGEWVMHGKCVCFVGLLRNHLLALGGKFCSPLFACIRYVLRLCCHASKREYNCKRRPDPLAVVRGQLNGCVPLEIDERWR